MSDAKVKMKMNKKWHDALAIVKQECGKIKDCCMCPFGDMLRYGGCPLKKDAPYNWKLEFIETEPTEEQGCDSVNHPVHYTQGKVECIDALEAATINLQGIEAVCTANAIKYLWRWKQKNGAEDLKKAKWYIDKLMQEERGCNHE